MAHVCPKGFEEEIDFLERSLSKIKGKSFCQEGLEKVCDGDGIVICL